MSGVFLYYIRYICYSLAYLIFIIFLDPESAKNPSLSNAYA